MTAGAPATSRRRESSRQLFGSDRGSASLYVVAFSALIVFVAVAAMLLGGVFSMRQRADTAADLAALAAARNRLSSVSSPCKVARTVADENGARLVACRLSAEAVEVTTEVRGTGLLGRLPPAQGRARAG